MSAAYDLPTAAEMARHDAKRFVEPDEQQFIVGGFATSTHLHDRIVEVMKEKGITWTQVANSLGRPSRQALVASVKRRLVYAPRLQELCAILEINPSDLIDQQFVFGQSIKLGIPSSPLT